MLEQVQRGFLYHPITQEQALLSHFLLTKRKLQLNTLSSGLKNVWQHRGSFLFGKISISKMKFHFGCKWCSIQLNILVIWFNEHDIYSVLLMDMQLIVYVFYEHLLLMQIFFSIIWFFPWPNGIHVIYFIFAIYKLTYKCS